LSHFLFEKDVVLPFVALKKGEQVEEKLRFGYNEFFLLKIDIRLDA
jgi:hypothetical protein